MSVTPSVLTQDFTLGYTYTRSTGPVVGRFFTELRNRNVVGIKGSDGKIIVPPVEYDPVTAEALSEFVDVADTGVVQSWCWVKEPRKSHPLDKPFAWAQVLMDGADTPMLHAVDVSDESKMATGMKVKVRWADEPRGHISDIACFETIDAVSQTKQASAGSEDQEPVTGVEEPIYLDYNFTAGKATTLFLQQVKQGRLFGQRCRATSKVYVPPRGSCPATGTATEEVVELSDKATVTSFTIVHIPIPNNVVQPPYIIANIVLDNADVSFLHLLSECVNEEIQIGQRVQAVWKPESEWDYSLDNIKYFKPIDEPPVDEKSTPLEKKEIGDSNDA